MVGTRPISKVGRVVQLRLRRPRRAVVMLRHPHLQHLQHLQRQLRLQRLLQRTAPPRDLLRPVAHLHAPVTDACDDTFLST
jgi:hypothetical protein